MHMEQQEQSKNHEAYEKIKDLILNRQFSPGQKLIYRDLQEILFMTKTPIVSALMMLERDGFVAYRKNRGFHV